GQSHRRGQPVRPTPHDHGVKIPHAVLSFVLQTWKPGGAPPELSEVPFCRPFDDRRPSTSRWGRPCAHGTVAGSRRHEKDLILLPRPVAAADTRSNAPHPKGPWGKQHTMSCSGSCSHCSWVLCPGAGRVGRPRDRQTQVPKKR